MPQRELAHDNRPSAEDKSSSSSRWGNTLFQLGVCVALFSLIPALYRFLRNDPLAPLVAHLTEGQDLCPQVTPIYPSKHMSLLEDLEKDLLLEDYRLAAYESLGAAIRIPTEIFDDMRPPGQDPRWDTFIDLRRYLEKRFPLVHSRLKKSIINIHALVFHWQGSDESLKPILLTAHQDVVPVPASTIDDWINPPFSGFYDGEWIWGRGSFDDKCVLIGTLLAIESLLAKGYKPTRSVVLAYGIDEERGGIYGTTAIRDYLLATYGHYGFSILVDEGGDYSEQDGFILSTPATAEKGRLDVRIEVATQGGHSSIPPPHTGIGILAALITELENHPHPTHIDRASTYYQTLKCKAQHDPNLSPTLRKIIKQSVFDGDSLSKLESILHGSKRHRANAGTTQAVDVIGGGIKTNALPETAWSIVNHRIAEYSSVPELQARMLNILLPVAEKFNLSIDAFGTVFGVSDSGSLVLSDAFGTALPPSPVTPTFGSGPWELLSGTIISTIKTSARNSLDDTVVVAPSVFLGNTDTRTYWNLTKHIFRYGHLASSDKYNGAHTINEAIKGEGFIELIRFFVRLTLNADESDLLG